VGDHAVIKTKLRFWNQLKNWTGVRLCLITRWGIDPFVIYVNEWAIGPKDDFKVYLITKIRLVGWKIIDWDPCLKFKLVAIALHFVFFLVCTSYHHLSSSCGLVWLSLALWKFCKNLDFFRNRNLFCFNDSSNVLNFET
jgi:hypothetical protein